MISELNPAVITFDPSGLVAAIVRDSRTRDILTLAWMNAESLSKTIETGETWFWSRSRQELWHKGATSGNRQSVVNMMTDCDGDAILIDVEPLGPACHTGARSCFDGESESWTLASLVAVLKERKAEMPEGSYAASLFSRGTDRILRKIGEEAIEVVLAAKGEGRQRLIEETGDLLFHVCALLVNEGIGLEEVEQELARRRRAKVEVG